MKKLSVLVVTGLTSLSAMTFGSFGYNHSIGNSGVAVKDSVYAYYYNPALIALTNKKVSVGVAGNGGFSGGGFLDLLQGRPVDKVELKGGGILGAVSGFNTKIGALTMAATFRPEMNTYFKSQQADTLSFTGSIGIIEVPVTYAYAFDFGKFGKLSIGATGKYMGAGMSHRFSINDTLVSSSSSGILAYRNLKHTGAVDLGVAYNVSIFTVGVTGKYLNAPEFDFKGTKVKIDPQARAGIAMDWGYLHLAADIDLTKNSYLMDKARKEQMVGFGVGFSGEWLGINAGSEYDLHNKELFWTVGARLGILDLAFRFSNEMDSEGGPKMPKYMTGHIGLAFRI